jgi:hypothetical protein
LAVPDCIAFLAGLKMRAVMDGRTPEKCGMEARGRNSRDSIKTSYHDVIDDSRLYVTFSGLV